MAKRQTEVVAASLLSAWTDPDTAMQVVGTSLGVFGPGPLDPTVVLATETPLRHALFDVLLSLVEGGALEMRAASDGRYAFRWRADIAVAGLHTNGSTAIDLEAPSPYLAEVERAHSERDAALTRAEAAETLAAEQQRLLRLDTREEGLLDMLYAQPPVPPSKPPAKKTAARKPAAAKPAPANAPRKPAAKRAAARPTEQPEADVEARNDVVYLTPPDSAAAVAADIDLVAAERAATNAEVEADDHSPRHRWSGYAIDKPHNRIAGLDR
jgi:hypothetical protein